MNERIKELAKQSLPEFYLTNCPSALEKFAELIVKECISINDRHYDASIASDEIKEHFRVEE